MKLAVLANGPSLATHDLTRIKIPVLGMNRSWKLYPSPDWHVALETDHYKANPEFFVAMARLGRLYVAGSGWPCGKVLAFANGLTRFSTSLKDGIVTELHGVGSVFYAALQVAYALGYRNVYALGLDLAGPHFDGSPASPEVARQNLMWRYIPQDMDVKVCGSPESLAPFPKVDFGAVCD